MEMLRSFRGDKHEICLAVIKFKHELIKAEFTQRCLMTNLDMESLKKKRES